MISEDEIKYIQPTSRRVQYRAIYNWLYKYQYSKVRNPSEKALSYIEAIHHSCKVGEFRFVLHIFHEKSFVLPSSSPISLYQFLSLTQSSRNIVEISQEILSSFTLENISGELESELLMIELLHAKAISELESELRKSLILLQKFCYKSKNHQAINLLARSFLGMHQITSGVYQKGIETLLNILEEIDYVTNTKWSPYLYDTKADILEKIAFYRMSQRNYKESIRLYDEAIDLNKELGLIYKNVMALANQGIVFRRTGNYEKSINVLEEAKSEIFKISNGSLNSWIDFTLSYVEHHLAYVFLDQNKLELAEHLCLKVLEKNKSMINDWGVADCYDQLGLISLRRRNLKEAEIYFCKSLSTRKMIGNPHSIVSSIFHLAALYRAKGEILKSVIYIMKGLNMYRRLGLFNFKKIGRVIELAKIWVSGKRGWRM